jgi:DNA-directed RNA polymerase subunit RPC12/RpoP
MSSEFNPAQPGRSGSLPKDARESGSDATATSVQIPEARQAQSTVAKPATAASAKIPWPAAPTAEQKPATTYKCPKCGTDARDVARFCPRCHTTLRFECPSCGNRQRAGGKCEKCGVDFIKYIGAVVAAKKAEADAVHDRLESRSGFLRALLLLPVNGGVSLIRYFFLKRDRN